MKIDPYKHEERWFNWKIKVSNGIPKINKTNSKLILNYLNDMEQGLNISTKNKKGARSYPRLNNLKQRMIFLTKEFESRFKIESLSEVTEKQLHEYFNAMRKGEIKTKDGKVYKSVADYVKIFKAFWHWHMKVTKKKTKKRIDDLTEDLDTRTEKPKWVYLDEEQVRKLIDNARYDYKVLMMFLFDTGIRAPTELMNIRVSDLFNDCKELQIRDEISKTFGRKIKLMICSELLKEYIKINNLKDSDVLFDINPASVNKYLKRRTKKLFGSGKSLAGEFYENLTMYDFRHISCCYWLPKYPTEQALKYRFGWKSSDKIHYYSEMLGMKDTISEEDLFDNKTKPIIIKLEDENKSLREEMDLMKEQMKQILELVEGMCERIR